MNKNYLYFFFILLFSLQVSAQERIYFDSSWSVTTKDNAVFYRDSKKVNNLTHIKDFYNNGTLQMEAYSSNPVVNNEVWEGEAKWFYPNGKLQTVSNYKNGNYLGVSKSYDEQGRLTSDFIYNKDESYSGKNFNYTSSDDEYTLNSVTEYKNSNTVKSVEFDKDITKMRKEVLYGKDDTESETRYYDEKGKLVGTGTTTNDGNRKGTFIDYLPNPMRMKHYDFYNKKGKLEVEREYYRNGKIQFELKQNDQSGTKKYYDSTGKFLGQILYKEAEEDYGVTPFEGTEFTFSDESDTISSSSVYKNGQITQEKTYYENGKIKDLINYGQDSYDVVDRITYDESGKQLYKMIYKEGSPYEGIEKFDSRIIQYSQGELRSEQGLNENGKVIYEKTLNKASNKYDHIVYGDDLKKKLSFSTNIEDEGSYFSGEITFFENGRAKGKAVIAEGLLQTGSVYLEDENSSIVYERKGDFLTMKQYDAKNDLVIESRTKIVKQEENYYDYDLKLFSEVDFIGNTDYDYAY